MFKILSSSKEYTKKQDELLLSNSTYRITFAANNIETANLISQLIGNKTVQQESLNKPKFLDLNPASRSLHISEIQRALLLPQEVIMLPRDDQIILIESTYPIKSKKILYYSDTTFTRRLLKQTRVPTQEPYDPNKVLSAAASKDKVNNEGIMFLRDPIQLIILLKLKPKMQYMMNQMNLQTKILMMKISTISLKMMTRKMRIN